MELYQKIYTKLTSEFHFEKAGDRSSMLLLSGFRNHQGSTPSSTQQIPHNAFADLLSKIKDSVIASFQHR